MAALHTLLGKARRANEWRNCDESLRDNTMALAVFAGAIGEALHKFFPTNSTVSGNSTFEYGQALAEGWADSFGFAVAAARPQRERSKDCK